MSEQTTDPHPWYGECDRLRPDGGCSECYKLGPSTDDMNDRVLAGLAWEEERNRCIALVKRWHPDKGQWEHPLVEEIRSGMRPEDARS